MLTLRGAHPDVHAIVGDNRYLMLCSIGYGFANEDLGLYEHFIYHIPGTPLAKLNGVEVPTEVLVDQTALEKLVDEAAAAGSGDPSPAASPAPMPL